MNTHVFLLYSHAGTWPHQTVIKCLHWLFALCGTAGFAHSDNGPAFVSKESKTYLFERGIASSTSSVYLPSGNGQAEKTVGTVWEAIQLALKSLDLPPSHWEVVLEDVLQSIRSLLCTATNTIPHERFFNFSRRSCSGESLPSWMTQGRKAYLRHFVRTSKNDLLVDEVELVTVNPRYARVRFPGGREVTVNVRDLAPSPQESSVPCQDRGHIGNADPLPRNGWDSDISPGNSGHTNRSQVDPDVEITPDSPSRDTPLPGSGGAERNICDDEGMAPYDNPLAVTKGYHRCDTGINNVMIRHFESAYYCRACFVHLQAVMYFCLCTNMFNIF